jgi:hypothetical protein
MESALSCARLVSRDPWVIRRERITGEACSAYGPEALQRVTPSQFISEGSVYGGGLHKVEPKELAQIPARGVLESIDGHVRIER